MSAIAAVGHESWWTSTEHEGWAILAQPPGRRDLACQELWERSLARSRRRREADTVRNRVVNRGTAAKVSAALATATVATPAAALIQPAAADASGAMMHRGARGAGVAAVQRALGIAADGVFGPMTRHAVRAFQAAHGLEVDGIVGPATRAALGVGAHSASANGAVRGPKPSPAVTRAVQAKLGVGVDGVYGPVTRHAVRAFQAAHGLEVDGIVGPITRAALGIGAHSSAAGGAVRGPKPSPSVTREVQAKLGVGVDGVYGPATRSAVKAFQAAHGLEVDGVVGPQTLSALGLSGSSTTSAPAASSGSASSAVAAAESVIGTPYVYGGTGAGGFDCSGLTQWAMAKAGISIPRTSYAQFGVGSAVSRSAIQAGDLVFFNTGGGGASHVGIATSNSTVISATTHGVMEHTISGPYWGEHYVGARRV